MTTKTHKPILIPAHTMGLSDIPEDYILRIDNSTLERFQTCPRSAYYYVIARKQKPGSPALQLGTAVHVALETFYLHGFTDESLKIAKNRVSVIYNLNPTNVDEYRNEEFAKNVVDAYFDEWASKEHFKAIEHDGRPFVERPFEIELGVIAVNDVLPLTQKELLNEGDMRQLYVRNLFVVWTGRIDLAVNHFDSLAVVDHKTTSMMGEMFFGQFALGQQPIGYCWALSKLLKARVRKFILNAIACRKPTKTGTSVECKRQVFNYTDAQLDEWEHDTMVLVSDFVSHVLRGYFPMSRVWCIGKYGYCPYHEVCTLDGDARDTMLHTMLYTDVDWDPTNERI